MRNFQKLASGLNVSPILHAIQRQPELWNQNDLRTTHPDTPHKQVDDIWLRFQDLAKFTPEACIDEHESINWPALDRLPQVRPVIFDLMRTVEGERLGRCIITRLSPGKRIFPHVDGGEHAAYYDRYHLALQWLPGCNFRAGDETICPQTGDLWWFDNSKEHEIVNNSRDDRITLIIDIRTGRRDYSPD